MDVSLENKQEYRPLLNKQITIVDFKMHYWLKEELQAFCRENGILAAGSKLEISQRIEYFLITRERKPEIRTNPHKFKSTMDTDDLSVKTVITEEYTNNQKNREFFKSIIGPQFHFTTRFMNFCKSNVGKTYQDAIHEWYAEQNERKKGKYKTVIAPQFEYNRFIREFYNKPENKGKKLTEAIKAWEKSKRERGK